MVTLQVRSPTWSSGDLSSSPPDEPTFLDLSRKLASKLLLLENAQDQVCLFAVLLQLLSSLPPGKFPAFLDCFPALLVSPPFLLSSLSSMHGSLLASLPACFLACFLHRLVLSSPPCILSSPSFMLASLPSLHASRLPCLPSKLTFQDGELLDREDFVNRTYRSANPRFKTEICRNFKEKGTCLYGELCQFAHGKHELRKDVVRHSKYKTKLCQKYWIAGYCAYGPRCNFIHQVTLLDADSTLRCQLINADFHTFSMLVL